MASYEALDIFGNKMINESEREALHKIIQLNGKKYWSGKYKELYKDFYFVPNVELIDKVLNLYKQSIDDWYKIVERGINKCGEYYSFFIVNCFTPDLK